MSIFNKTLGAGIGGITGLLTALIKLPYVYYVVYRTLNEAGYSWPVKLVATPLLGTLGLACAVLGILITSFFTVYKGMKTGWNEGIIAAFKFPICIHSKSKIKRNRHLATKGLFFELRIELANLISIEFQKENVEAAKNNLIQKIEQLPIPENFTPQITKTQINTFRKKVNHRDRQGRTDELIKQDAIVLTYINRLCPLTGKNLLFYINVRMMVS